MGRVGRGRVGFGPSCPAPVEVIQVKSDNGKGVYHILNYLSFSLKT